MSNINKQSLKELFITWHPKRDLTAADAEKVKATFDVPEVSRYYVAVEDTTKAGEKTDVHFHMCVTYHDPHLVADLKKIYKATWGINHAGLRGGNKTELSIKPLDDFMRMAGGYATKATAGLFQGPSKGVDILELKQGQREWDELQAVRKKVILKRDNVLHYAMSYRKRAKLATTDLSEVLSHMCQDNYSVSGLCGRFKGLPREYKEIFRLTCEGKPITKCWIEENVYE